MHLQLEPELLKAIDGARGLVPRNAWIGEVLYHRVTVRTDEVPVPVSVGAGSPSPQARPPAPTIVKASELPLPCASTEHKRKLVFGGTCPDCGQKLVKK